MGTKRVILAEDSKGDFSNAGHDDRYFGIAYAGLITGNVGLEKIFCYTVFFEKLSFNTGYYLFK